jgi:hypothetical protein
MPFCHRQSRRGGRPESAIVVLEKIDHAEASDVLHHAFVLQKLKFAIFYALCFNGFRLVRGANAKAVKVNFSVVPACLNIPRGIVVGENFTGSPIPIYIHKLAGVGYGIVSEINRGDFLR